MYALAVVAVDCVWFLAAQFVICAVTMGAVDVEIVVMIAVSKWLREDD